MSLFEDPAPAGPKSKVAAAPLAERMRPRSLAEFLGQDAIVGDGRTLRAAIETGGAGSLILWGPPGVGKTTLALLIAQHADLHFRPFSAVLAGVAQVRAIVAEAAELRQRDGRGTLLFVDEIHRFNKAQQDAFLPHVEKGDLVLVGATTENPSFAVNAALLSRCKVFHLDLLAPGEIAQILRRAVAHDDALRDLEVTDDAIEAIARVAQGDARRSLSMLEAAARHAEATGERRVTAETLEASDETAPLRYDKDGEEHYNVTSAFIKSMRGSDPDASVYWLMRMVDAGEDPLFILRRMVIFASEDVGNADPRALTVVTSADAAFRRLGMPEGLYPLAHATLYLACTAKSNAVGTAFTRARALIEKYGASPVPKKLRNAPTKLMKQDGYGAGYKYAHDFAGGFVPGESYLPDEIGAASLYEPTERGEEARIKARLAAMRASRE